MRLLSRLAAVGNQELAGLVGLVGVAFQVGEAYQAGLACLEGMAELQAVLVGFRVLKSELLAVMAEHLVEKTRILAVMAEVELLVERVEQEDSSVGIHRDRSIVGLVLSVIGVPEIETYRRSAVGDSEKAIPETGVLEAAVAETVADLYSVVLTTKTKVEADRQGVWKEAVVLVVGIRWQGSVVVACLEMKGRKTPRMER